MKYFSGMSYEEAVAKFKEFMALLTVQCFQMVIIRELAADGEISQEELDEAEELHERNHETSIAMAEELDQEVAHIVNETNFSLN